MTEHLSRFVRTPKGLLLAVFAALLVPAALATGATSLAHVAWAVAGAVVVDLVGGGFLVLDKVNKWAMAVSFLAALYGVFTALAFASPALVAEMYRAPFIQSSLFLAFFMLTDPPTSPGKTSDQLWMGALAGLTA